MEIHENRRKSKTIEKERLKGKQERKVVKNKKKNKSNRLKQKWMQKMKNINLNLILKKIISVLMKIH